MSDVTMLPKVGKSPWFVVLFGVMCVLYFLVASLAADHGVFSTEMGILAGRAEIVQNGTDTARREALTANPPLVFLLLLILGNPVLVVSLTSAFVTSFMVFAVWKGFERKRFKLIILFYCFLTPSVIILALFQPLLFIYIFVFSLANYFLLEFYRTEYSFYVFVFSLWLGVLFLIYQEILLFIPFVALGFVLILRDSRMIGVYLFVSLFPTAFFICARCMIAYLLTGVFPDILPFNGIGFNLAPSEIRVLLIHSVPHVLLYLYLFIKVGGYREFYSSPMFVVMLSPFVLLLTASSFEPVSRLIGYHVLFMFTLIVLFPYLKMFAPEVRMLRMLPLLLAGICIWDFGTFILYGSYWSVCFNDLVFNIFPEILQF
jgi:hypothetical protein